MLERVEGKTFPVIYLIPITFLISLSRLHFHCQPLSLILCLCHSELHFGLSLHCLPPLFPPSHLHSSLSSFPSSFLPFPSVSPIKTSHHRQNQQKVKIYKTAIRRFMCHSQTKYNSDCVQRVREVVGRDWGGRRGHGRKVVVFQEKYANSLSAFAFIVQGIQLNK